MGQEMLILSNSREAPVVLFFIEFRVVHAFVLSLSLHLCRCNYARLSHYYLTFLLLWVL
jgi:hypothetical protein